MTQKYRKDKLSKNGSNWYIQFHIADWMRQLPHFKDFKNNKKNFKESLRTADYDLACQRRDQRLIELNLKENTLLKPLKTGSEAYWMTVEDISTLNDQELEQMHSYYSDIISSNSSEIYPHETGKQYSKIHVQDEKPFDNAENAILAIEREFVKRETKVFDKPHPYPSLLKAVCKNYIKELAIDGRDKKTQSKAHLSMERFLDFLERDDIELRLVTSKLLNDYRKQASIEQRSESTFRSDLHHLSSMFEFAKRENLLPDHHYNPFKNVKLTNLREGIKRQPFTKEILQMLLKLSINDRDSLQTIYLSYYTGMRISEVFTAKIITEGNVLCLNVAEDGGKTASARRIIPMHSQLIKFLNDRNWMPKINDGFDWQTSSDNGLGKKFLRMKDKALEELGMKQEKARYVHHSFRHSFSTMLLQSGYSELQIADLLGHKKENIGRTEAGRTYFSRQNISKLIEMVESIPVMER